MEKLNPYLNKMKFTMKKILKFLKQLRLQKK